MLLEYAMKSEVRMRQFQDPITLRVLNDQESRAEIWSKMWQSFLDTWRVSSIHEACNGLYVQLTETGRGEGGQAPMVPLCPHAPDSFLSDHALLTSAIAYCLAYDDQDLAEADRQLLQLAALSHEVPNSGHEAAVFSGLRDQLRVALPATVDKGFLEQAWRLLDQQGGNLAVAAEQDNSLAAFADQQPQTGDRRLDLLWYAHLVASQPLFNQRLSMLDGQPSLDVVKAREDFQSHPLATMPGQWNRIGLVHGGASKIKDYVFESAKLPEIRGASALLDRLNLEDTRALFGEALPYRQVAPATLIEAPECVIYANGGDVLALAPASKAQELADAIERRYSEETLVAQCVAVAGIYSLLELQYGLAPDRFWADDYLDRLQTTKDEAERRLLRSYYGDPKDYHGTLTDEQMFHMRKSFGELTTALALKRFWRREGNEGAWLGHPNVPVRSLVHFEALPFGQRCSSCDRRIAVQIEATTGDVLCEPCLRKRCVGWETRAIRKDSTPILEPVTDWRADVFTPWPEKFRETLERQANSGLGTPDPYSYYMRNANQPWESIDSASDLEQIGQTAKPNGFIGLIYADGNNVGALIERIRSAAFYRQFASRLFEATQVAVFTALARHLQPTRVINEDNDEVFIHPFEIVSIGGDDLILIVPSDKALGISLDIATHIEEVFHDGDINYQDSVAGLQRYHGASFSANGKPRISLSAGVVLAQENNPIFFLNDIVQELLKSAKAKAKQLKEEGCTGCTGGTVDFMALKSVTMVTSSVGEFRRTALREVQTLVRGKRYEALHLTARPYTLHELRGLLRTAAVLQKAEFPRSQLYHLRQELFKGRFLSSLSYLYFTSRLAPTHSALVRTELDQSWHEVNDLVPWRKRFSKQDSQQPAVLEWESVLADIVEIYDFVSALVEE